MTSSTAGSSKSLTPTELVEIRNARLDRRDCASLQGVPLHYSLPLSNSLSVNLTRLSGVASQVKRAREMFYVGYR
jgi:hypothetical protein